MTTYAITFRDTKTTISFKAAFYEIDKGFIRIFNVTGGPEENTPYETAAYNCDNVLHIVEQNEYDCGEVLKQMKEYEEAKERME